MSKYFSFTDLSMMDGMDGMITAKPFDGMASGAFTDMWGRDVVFLAADLPEYVQKTKLALESTRDASGQIVGFPIDTYDHANGQAAGFIVDVNMATDGRDVIQFTPRWNSLGMDAVGSDTLRYFSPSIDDTAHVIIGGSMTNWPATRTKDHQILLHPVELSSTMYSLDTPPAVTLGAVFKAGISELKTVLSGLGKTRPEILPEEKEEEPMSETVELAQPVPAVLDLSSPEAQLEINRRAELKAAAIVAANEHAAAVLSFASVLIGNKGMPVDHDRLAAFLSKLPAELYPEAEAILTAVADRKPLDFKEAGTAEVVSGSQPLPDEIKPAFKTWIDAGLSKEDFFTANAVELGVMSDYNLSEFYPVKEIKS